MSEVNSDFKENSVNEIKVIDTFKISSAGIHLKKYHMARSAEAFNELRLNVSDFLLRSMYRQIEEKNIHLKTEMKAQITFDSTDLKKSICVISEIDLLPTPLTLEVSKNYFQLSGRGLQNHKTNRRDYWNLLMKSAHCFDVIGVNQDGCLTETSRFNIFLQANNTLYTPKLDSGCINGALRRSILDAGLYKYGDNTFSVKEKDILATDINNYEIFVGNSLRGMHKAILI